MAQTLNTKTSVVDALKAKNLPSDFASRAKLAAAKGITNYTGTAAQNDKLRSLVNRGAGTSLKASGTGGNQAAPSSKPASVAIPKPVAKAVSAQPKAAPVVAVKPSGKAATPAQVASATKSPPAVKAAPATVKQSPSSPVARTGNITKDVLSGAAFKKMTKAEATAYISQQRNDPNSDLNMAKQAAVSMILPSGIGLGGLASLTRNAAKSLPAAAAKKVLVSTAKKALPSSSKPAPFASGKPSAPTSNSTTIRTGKGTPVQSQPRPSQGLPAPKKALPAPKPAAPKKAAAPKKPAAPKKKAAAK